MKKFSVWKSLGTGYLHALPQNWQPLCKGFEFIGYIEAKSQFEADNLVLMNTMPKVIK